MNTRQLNHFLAVMHGGSLSVAAREANISPSALSRSLKALEDALRVPLFDRTGGRLTPTPFAQAYIKRARRIVFEQQEGVRAMTMMRTGELGPLSFGMGSTLAAAFAGQLILHLQAGAPQLRLAMMVRTSDRLLQELVQEHLDFFVGDICVAEFNPDVTVEPLLRSRLGWFAAVGHPLAKRRRIPFEVLLDYPIVAAGHLEDVPMRQMSELYRLDHPITDDFMVVTDDFSTVLRAVTGGSHICASTDFAMLDARRDRLLTRLDVAPAPNIELTLGIVRLAGRTLPPAAEEAFAFIRAHFKSAAAQLKRISEI